MAQELITLPKKRVNRFFHPRSSDLILSMAGAGMVFTFWNAINIRPSLLTDPAYQSQKQGLELNMNISMAVISLLAVGVTAIYKERGYIATIAMIGVGAGMYAWTASQLNNIEATGETSSSVTLSDSVRAKSMSVLYHPHGYVETALPIKTRREHAMA